MLVFFKTAIHVTPGPMEAACSSGFGGIFVRSAKIQKAKLEAHVTRAPQQRMETYAQTFDKPTETYAARLRCRRQHPSKAKVKIGYWPPRS